jgi:hypothetical protein
MFTCHNNNGDGDGDDGDGDGASDGDDDGAGKGENVYNDIAVWIETRFDLYVTNV